MRFMLLVILCVPVLLFSDIFSQKAYAYLDPGSGSYIFQIIIAAAVGGLFVIKLYWGKLINFFRNLFSKGKKK